MRYWGIIFILLEPCAILRTAFLRHFYQFIDAWYSSEKLRAKGQCKVYTPLNKWICVTMLTLASFAIPSYSNLQILKNSFPYNNKTEACRKIKRITLHHKPTADSSQSLTCRKWLQKKNHARLAKHLQTYAATGLECMTSTTCFHLKIFI